MIGILHNPQEIVFDRYKIIGYLNQGGMQEVYRARDELLMRDVALKVPKNPSAAKRFKRSAQVSAMVNHSNVAKTLDYFEANGRSYLIEELIDGPDLGQVLKQYRFIEPHMVARLLHRLAKGLAASHHVNVIHRDLKPSNVIAVGGVVATDVKITDFGIAKMAEVELEEAWVDDQSLTASQTAIGALPYMAPEMIQSVKDVTIATDVWSLGAMVFELMSGKKPFGVGLPAVNQITHGPMPKLPEICTKRQFQPLAAEVHEIVLKCLTRDPANRPSADFLVKLSEDLCYINSEREIGISKDMNNSYWGFASDKNGEGLFFHRDSIYGGSTLSAGQNIVFVRHKGGQNDRAFPIQSYL